MNKRYPYALSIIALIVLLSHFQVYNILAQNSLLDQQTKNVSNDKINQIQNKEPTETRDGGEYSGLEETGVQNTGIPNKDAESTPQAPISGINVKDTNNENASPFVNVTNTTK